MRIDSLAVKALMSQRTFTRHFRQLTGPTVLDSFDSPESLRHHFRQTFGVTPTAWLSDPQGGEEG